MNQILEAIRLKSLHKAEVHLHLEGCFEAVTIAQWPKMEGVALVSMLVDRQIPLGICPTSNLVLGVYPSILHHPLEKLRSAGVRVSINTNAPALLGARPWAH